MRFTISLTWSSLVADGSKCEKEIHFSAVHIVCARSLSRYYWLCGMSWKMLDCWPIWFDSIRFGWNRHISVRETMILVQRRTFNSNCVIVSCNRFLDKQTCCCFFWFFFLLLLPFVFWLRITDETFWTRRRQPKLLEFQSALIPFHGILVAFVWLEFSAKLSTPFENQAVEMDIRFACHTHTHSVCVWKHKTVSNDFLHLIPVSTTERFATVYSVSLHLQYVKRYDYCVIRH